MFNIPSARLTVPRTTAGEIVRNRLTDAILNSPARLVYIHAGAGCKDKILMLWRKAARYYFDRGQYSRVARYATCAKDNEHLEKIILACYRDYIKTGNYNELMVWFQALDDAELGQKPEILVAKGTFLSVIGNFVQARECLEAATPLLNLNDKELYFEAMIHKPRVLRNFASFEESNMPLDELIKKLDIPPVSWPMPLSLRSCITCAGMPGQAKPTLSSVV